MKVRCIKKHKNFKIAVTFVRIVCFLNIIALTTLETQIYGTKAGVIAILLAIGSISYAYIRILTLYKEKLDKIISRAEQECIKIKR